MGLSKRPIARVLCAALVMLGLPANLAASGGQYRFPADPAARAFITSNVVATFYHELGHALIHVLDLPVPGNEEDAADMLSTLMINDIWEETSAAAMVYDTAFAFRFYADEESANGYEVDSAGGHSLDMQRYFNMACLFYGADPGSRAGIAMDLGLPPGRADGCIDEFQHAESLWRPVLGEVQKARRAGGLRLVNSDPDGALGALLAEQIRHVNRAYGFGARIDVAVEHCGAANAFYDRDRRQITICAEYAADLERIFSARR